MSKTATARTRNTATPVVKAAEPKPESSMVDFAAMTMDDLNAMREKLDARTRTLAEAAVQPLADEVADLESKLADARKALKDAREAAGIKPEPRTPKAPKAKRTKVSADGVSAEWLTGVLEAAGSEGVSSQNLSAYGTDDAAREAIKTLAVASVKSGLISSRGEAQSKRYLAKAQLN